jgi:epoxyqueuosine reductase
MSGVMNGLQREIVAAMAGFTAESPLNRFNALDGSRMFEEPLVAFADGEDPLFPQIKAAIGEFHLTPREFWQTQFGEANDPMAERRPLTAMVWALPSDKETRASNRRMTDGPSVRWHQTRNFGEDFLTSLANFVTGFFQERGIRAMSPDQCPSFKRINPENAPATSNWSLRHLGYTAGLGTFGLNEALITTKGVAHRMGSVLVEAELPPTPRPYASRNAYCAFFVDGSCGKCIERCPGGALSASGHDKLRCAGYQATIRSWLVVRKDEGYTGKITGCGLCMTKVPCEASIPPVARKAKK